MTFPFTFEVVAIDAIDGHVCFRESGIGLCENFTEAMNYIENYYGDSLIKVLELELLEQGNLIFLPKDYITEFKKEKFSKPEIIIPCDTDGNILETF